MSFGCVSTRYGHAKMGSQLYKNGVICVRAIFLFCLLLDEKRIFETVWMANQTT